jgi:hypothetical protein
MADSIVPTPLSPVMNKQLEKAVIYEIDVTTTSGHEFKPATIVKNGTPPSERQPLDAMIICKMPVSEKLEFKPTKISKIFECEYPSVDANIARERQPLPFPEDLSEVIAWTDAFVDRIASMTVAKEKASPHQILRTHSARLHTDMPYRKASRI